ncbi:hypothetical protein BOTBODRAFT_25954 [Botryobasidium botryosum FD-172 SS1]|uniref:Uncharacterized protein n=1 Tax=Botryobasidium botryosum (strain FD-172 SS1) TaxID=930990 RepID=A0A067NBK7_BOTB1|nr:hypothetical protein BOTBODRAFT_25954 [Botryobasidium botryosum FD-172 SS1]
MSLFSKLSCKLHSRDSPPSIKDALSHTLPIASVTAHAAMDRNAVALRCKTEGEELAEQGQWAEAHDRYSQALNADPGAADILASRATCAVKLEKNESAIADAKRALEFDPTNANAWHTLAQASTALEQWITAYDAYDRAIRLLKIYPDSGANKKLIAQYEREYEAAKKAAEERRDDGKRNLMVVSANEGDRPWERAQRMLENYDTDTSSAWIIAQAHEEFQRGLTYMRELHELHTPSEGSPTITRSLAGNPQAITYVTNGIIRDERCFFMDSSDFIKRFQDQSRLEVLSKRAWDLSADDKHVIVDARRRVERKGWPDVRPALSTTIRIWILNAHIAQGLTEYGQAVVLYRRALAVLAWGRKEWAHVSRKERGSIFDTAFVRGVRTLFGNVLLRAYEAHRIAEHQPDTVGSAISSTPSYPLREIVKVAEEIMEDCRAHPLTSSKPGFTLSYQRYPEGKARLMKGVYYLESGRQQLINNREDGQRLLRLAANEYQNALNFFPEDDEYHTLCVYNALDCLFMARSPLRETLPLLGLLRKSAQSSDAIWSQSSFANGGGRKRVGLFLKFEATTQALLKDKRGWLDESLIPGAEFGDVQLDGGCVVLS